MHPGRSLPESRELLGGAAGNTVEALTMRDLTQDSDEDLLRRSAAGDEEAFTALYRRRQAAVYRFALHMSGREDVAEEVTQETFLMLIREPDRFNSSRGTVPSFLFGVARNLVLRHLARRRDYVDIAEQSVAAETDLLAQMTREEAIEAVRQAISSLPTSYRDAVVLCDLEEASYADAADALGVPVGTVRSRLNRGRGLLMEKLRAVWRGFRSLGCSA
jgi:RNA polymerase sigma-70 factor, ECF subfamily